MLHVSEEQSRLENGRGGFDYGLFCYRLGLERREYGLEHVR